MADKQPSAAQRALGDFAPKIVELTDQVLFGDIWERPELSKRDRSLITCAALVATGLWLVALVGTLFSIYLTVLEPFVIGATCMWCVASAVAMTLLLWAATPAAVDAWTDLSDDGSATT